MAGGHVCVEGGDVVEGLSVILTCSEVEPHLRRR